MRVKVSVPSLLNSYDNLKDILSSLETQSFSDFELDIIIPKNIDPKDEYLELFDQYKGNIRIINQSSKGFENAVNSAIQGNYDINISTDDDAILPMNHLSNVVKKLSNPRIGIITGRVNGKLPYLNRTLYLYFLSSFLSEKRDILNYKGAPVIYFNSTGFLTLNPFHTEGLFQKDFKTMSPIGVNMAWSKESLANFHLLEFSRLGTLNEAYMSYHAFENGYDTIFSKELNVIHKVNVHSLSRQNTLYDDLTKFLEFFFSPHILRKSHVFNKNLLSKVNFLTIPSKYKRLLEEILKTLESSKNQGWSDKEVKSAYDVLLNRVKSNYYSNLL